MSKLFGAIIFLVFIQQNVGQTALQPKADVEKRVDAILSKMTQEEKIEIIGGINDFYTRPIPRLGIPSLRMSDGPTGVHDYGLTTAYRSGFGLATRISRLADRFRDTAAVRTPGLGKSGSPFRLRPLSKARGAHRNSVTASRTSARLRFGTYRPRLDTVARIPLWFLAGVEPA
jgi:hypothetical protein